MYSNIISILSTEPVFRYYYHPHGCRNGHRCPFRHEPFCRDESFDRHEPLQQKAAPEPLTPNTPTIKIPRSAAIIAEEQRIQTESPDHWVVICDERARVQRQEQEACGKHTAALHDSGNEAPFLHLASVSIAQWQNISGCGTAKMSGDDCPTAFSNIT